MHVLFPELPLTTSVPSPPSSVSSPAPLRTSPLPSPAKMTSSPAAPRMLTLPYRRTGLTDGRLVRMGKRSQHVVVIGGGTMGIGIAASCVLVQDRVRIVEVDADRARDSEDRARASLVRAALRRGIGDQIDELQALLEVGTSHPDSADLVVEAVPENLALKQAVIGGLEDHYPDDTLIATNTSSLSIDAIAETLRHPERFVGMHFFNPVPASELVEIVVGEQTAPETTMAAVGWAERLGKTAIVVCDSPGFASSRLGVMLGIEAIRMLEEGVASAEDIDRAMMLGYKHPIGPLKLTDLVGIDVRLAIAEHLSRELGERFEPPQLMRDMVSQGHLGKKTGQGFYEW